MTDAYLHDLERAVRDLPKPLADEIVGGVREELRGLDAAAAAERIAELGDPQFIAASARAEVPARHDATWYTVLTIALLAIGGFLVPVLGWLVGLVMLWYSRTWLLRDKLVGTLLLPACLAVTLGISAIIGAQAQVAALSNDGGFPSIETVNPLIPNTFDLTHSAVLATVLITPIITTVYLAVRARRLRSIQRP